MLDGALAAELRAAVSSSQFRQGVRAMKLVTFDNQGARAGLVLGDMIHDIATHTSLPASLLDIVRLGAPALAELRALAASLQDTPGIPLGAARLLAPIPRPARNIFCVGLNYQAHIDEGRTRRGEPAAPPAKRAEFPTFFTKAPSTVTGPGSAVPAHSQVTQRLDWEVELGVVLGTSGVNISSERAPDHIFGYTIVNDVSARDLQMRHGGQWFKGKTLDGTCPMGPWIVTRDELGATDALSIRLKLNGVVKQDSNTRFMLFDLPTLISELSKGLTLEAGDIIATGTPDGIGAARQPPEFLKPGDVVECEIEGIGTLRHGVGP
jgi:2-keto-4-pentenoate hydratase/2-oxohepta-3-ene-1,7-dioic acid hydratase in catechol pathway